MTHDLKPYPAYKDSGVPWLGQVPEHWEVKRLKSVATLKSGDSITAEEIDKVGKYPVYGGNGLRGFTNRFTHEGHYVLIGRQGALCGNINYAKDKFWASEHAVVVTPCMQIATMWLGELLRNMNLNQYSIAAAQPGLAIDRIKDIVLPLPPFFEQAAIVRYLDYVDRRIRRYIRAQEKLVKLLEEQKQAVIHHAVTRGLNPNVRLKPSGVEWLGDVPEHWEVRRNGRLFIQRNETGFADLPILEVSLKTGIRIRNFESSDRKQVMTDRDKYKRAVTGDIAYNMMRMWQGSVGVVPNDGLVSPAYIVAKPLRSSNSRYFVYLFRLAVYMAEIDKYSRGIVKDRNRLYWEDFKRMPSCYPPLCEQLLIADVIDDLCRTVGTAIAHIYRKIALLREYRTRLIADVVTGKLDVREAAARLPKEATTEEPDAPEVEEVAENDEVDTTEEETA